MRKESQENNFYQELDRKSRRHSCCSCKTMVVFFTILLIFFSILTIYFYKQIKKVNISFNKISPSSVSENSFIQKLAIDPQKNSSFFISVTSEELTTVSSKGVKTFAFEMKDIQVEIGLENILSFGKMTKPLKSDMKIQTLPKVQNDKVYFEVIKISAGKLTLPGLLSSEIEKGLNKLMNENFQSLYENYKVENIKLQENQMIISGSLK